MAITKTGASIMNSLKRFGSKAWDVAGTVSDYAFPAVTTAITANDIASGQRSVGEAVGEAAGGTAGYFGAKALTNKLTNRFNIKRGRGIINFVVPIASSMFAAGKGSEMLGKVLPMKRSPISAQTYMNNYRGPGGNISA